MERPIVVIITGTRSSPRIILVDSHVTELRDVHCARLTRKMSFLGWVK
jgi:ATP:corrinoid adenosyltransferase